MLIPVFCVVAAAILALSLKANLTCVPICGRSSQQYMKQQLVVDMIL